MVKFLLHKNANPAKSNRSGWTALHHAAFHGQTRAIATILGHAEVHRHLVKLRNAFGATLLNVAVAGGHAPAVR